MILPTTTSDGYDAKQLPLTAFVKDVAGGADRPVWIYVHGSAEDPVAFEKQEQKLFGKDELAISSLFFECYRIEASSLSQTEREEVGKALPAFLLFSPSGKLIAKTSGGASSAPTLVSFLGKSWREVYGDSLQSRISKFEDFLNRLEKAEDKAELAAKKVKDLEAKADKKSDQVKVAEAKTDLEAAQKELAAAKTERDTLLAPPAAKADN